MHKPAHLQVLYSIPARDKRKVGGPLSLFKANLDLPRQSQHLVTLCECGNFNWVCIIDAIKHYTTTAVRQRVTHVLSIICTSY